uniref:Gypsy retrotransposon integrase-like protein 1 n=1 Tax=Paramormyrops kingsleyae TaxID=1676925 RepID=A0A3B3SNI1_9TELE
MKSSKDYWRVTAQNCDVSEGSDTSLFLDMMAGVTRWQGAEIPSKVGTVKLTQAVTLLAGHEHLVWGRLPKNILLSPGSTVIVEPTSSKSMPRNILVGRVITSMWSDGYIPMKIMNLSGQPVTLKRNCKLADVSPCVAAEDFTVFQNTSQVEIKDQSAAYPQSNCADLEKKLAEVGLEGIDINFCQISHSTQQELVQLLISHNDIFSKHALDCGEAKGFSHRIRLIDERPFRLPYRRVPPAHYQKLRQALTDMEDQDIIRKSTSEFASPLVMVWKKDGSLRICTDFRWLNARTLKDAHPLPHQSDCLASLGGNVYFSTMDLTSGFYNIPMHEEDKKYTAFITPLGLHEYNRMPQGLCNSPASFMRMMLSVFGDLNFTQLLCYLDDLLVFAATEKEALSRLEVVFQRLRQHNLKLSPKKCHLLQTSVRFLGHVVKGGGVAVDPGKVEVISRMTTSDLMEDDKITPLAKRIKSFLGMIFYYQHFIANCSAIARPLFVLTAGQKRKCRGKVTKQVGTFRKLKASDWTTECDTSFSTLKEKLLNCAVLAHPDFSRPFILSIDASLDGLGAVLSQIPPGEDKARPIAFASKTLTTSQRRYPAHRLEFLSLKWSVCEKFSHWLKGNTFTVWTDNNPLTYIMTKPKLDACEQRWVAKLVPYAFEIRHIAGNKNVVADVLSRDPFTKTISHRLLSEQYDSLLSEAEGVSEEGIQDTFRLKVLCHRQESETDPREILPVTCSGICNAGEVNALCEAHDNWELAAESRAVQLIQSVQQFASSSLDTLSELSMQKLQQKQEEDHSIAVVVPFVARKRRPSRHEKANLSPSALSLSKQWDRLTFLNGILYRVTKDPMSKQKRYQYVLPQSLKAKALSGIHDQVGHQGQARTLHLARQRFYWPKMEQDIKSYVKHCQRCILAKSPEPSARAPLESIITSAPMELVCLDFWSAEDSKQNSVDVLVVTDHFTKLAHAFPCANQKAKQVARKLWDQIFCVYGFPERIHTDQGANFESGLIAELLNLSGVAKSHTTAYHPMGNGGTERFNRTLGSMLRSLPLKAKHQWPQQIQSLTFAYNATVHETTGFPPFYLMFGRVPRLPVDVMFRQVLRDPMVVDYSSHAKTLLSHLHEAASIAQRHSTKEQQKQARGYNKRVKGTHLNVGDRVLIANKGERGRRKLADKWEATVYVVINRNPRTHTYVVQDEKGATRVVHRNLLLDISFLPVQMESGGTGNSHLDGSDDERGSVADSQPQDLADCLESESSERRTSLWVLDETERSLGSQSETGSVQFCSEGEQQSQGDDCSEKPSEDESPMTDLCNSQTGCFNSDSDRTTPIMETRDVSKPEQPNQETGNLDTQGVGNTQERATRAGRVAKKVNRLIESMAQRPFTLK